MCTELPTNTDVIGDSDAVDKHDHHRYQMMLEARCSPVPDLAFHAPVSLPRGGTPRGSAELFGQTVLYYDLLVYFLSLFI